MKRYKQMNGLLPVLMLLNALFYCGVLMAQQGAANRSIKKVYSAGV